jgi:transposase
VDEAVVVADSALLSKKNIEIVKTSGYKYILGAKLKNMSKAWQKKVVENTDFETHTIYHKDKADDKQEILKIKEYKYAEGENLIISRSSLRAEKDKHDREKAIEKLLLKLKKSTNPSNLISNYGYKKYLQLEGKSTVCLNEEKIVKDALWDGLHGVRTNIESDELNAFGILKEYHGLWQIEDSFRIDKHDLRMRPVFHWTPNRIKAHITICYVAFSLIRFLQHLIKKETDVQFSARRISLELNSVQQSILHDIKNNKNKYVIPSKSSENVLTIYKAMKLHRKTVPYKLRE